VLQITSYYDSPDNAAKTMERLRTLGFTDAQVSLRVNDLELRRWIVSVQAPFGMGRMATEVLRRYHPLTTTEAFEPDRSPTLDAISRLSGPVSPGAISPLSAPKPVGAIRTLSGRKNPGAIAALSGRRSPGAISKLSAPKPVGAISRLSQPRPVGAISRLSAGWYWSERLGMPLLTRRQTPLEPEETLLVSESERRH
jgi:hypothetical protein